MKFIKDLFINKNTERGRRNLTFFLINTFLTFVHCFLMVFYCVNNHKFMIIANIFSLVYYLTFTKICIKYKKLYIKMTFGEIWIHTLLGICCFGWDASFQNYIFALLVAVFFPAFKPESSTQSYRLSLVFSIIVILSYFIFASLLNVFDFGIMFNLNSLQTTIIFIFNNLISFATIMLFAIEYTLNKKKKEFELSRRADFDELTEIYNRYSLDTIGNKVINKCKELNKPYSVAILDIDFFKKVNDTYGHPSGDIVLKEIGKILKQYADKNFTVGRWGGEEFLLIGDYSIKYSEFVSTLKKIKQKIGKNKFIIENNIKVNCTVSIGSASIYGYKTLEEAVSIADNNLYKAKNTGRNKVVS